MVGFQTCYSWLSATFLAGCISTGAVSVSYYPEHSGHDCELARVSLRKEQRKHIASKLATGKPFDDVLGNEYHRASSSRPTSLQFLTKKDLYTLQEILALIKVMCYTETMPTELLPGLKEPNVLQMQNLARFVKFTGNFAVPKHPNETMQNFRFMFQAF